MTKNQNDFYVVCFFACISIIINFILGLPNCKTFGLVEPRIKLGTIACCLTNLGIGIVIVGIWFIDLLFLIDGIKLNFLMTSILQGEKF